MGYGNVWVENKGKQNSNCTKDKIPQQITLVLGLAYNDLWDLESDIVSLMFTQMVNCNMWPSFPWSK